MSDMQRKHVFNRAFLTLAVIVQVACTSVHSWKRSTDNTNSKQPDDRFVSGRFEKVCDLPFQEEYCRTGFQFVNERDGWIFCGNSLSRTSNGGKSWENINVASDKNFTYVEFEFVSPQIGWKYARDAMQKTGDGGLTWTPVNIPIQKNKGLISSTCWLDNENQWIAGGVFEPIPLSQSKKFIEQRYWGEQGTALSRAIFFTNDGGKTWRKQQAKSLIGSEFFLYVSKQKEIWAISGTELFHLIAGRWEETDFIKSSCGNHGLLTTVGLSQKHGDIYGISSIYFADKLHGWLSFSNGYVAKTTDGGQSWCDLLEPDVLQEETDDRSFFWEMYFADTATGWGRTDSGKLYETKDGGSTWIRLHSDMKFSSMCFLDAQNGWVIAQEGLFRIQL